MNSYGMLLGFLIGILLGNFPSVERPRPAWWQWLALGLPTVTIVLALTLPLAGTFSHVDLKAPMLYPEVPLMGTIDHASKQYDAERDVFSVRLTDFARQPQAFVVEFKGKEPARLSGAGVIIVETRRDTASRSYLAGAILNVDPFLTIDFVPALMERVRNIFFHVPMSWIGFLAYLLTMIWSVQYLRTRDAGYDIKAHAAAALGTIFTALATLTGMIWAKADWGTYWNWDPRQTTIFVLLMIYGAYFALRGAVEQEDKRARLSAVYSIFAFVTVPFLGFILPRVIPGLHPASAPDDPGPLFGGGIDPEILALYTLSLFSFTILFFWLLSLSVRTKKLEYRADSLLA